MPGAETANARLLVYRHKTRHDSGAAFPANKDLHGIDKLAKFLVPLTCWPSWEVNLEQYWDRDNLLSSQSGKEDKADIARAGQITDLTADLLCDTVTYWFGPICHLSLQAKSVEATVFRY